MWAVINAYTTTRGGTCTSACELRLLPISFPMLTPHSPLNRDEDCYVELANIFTHFSVPRCGLKSNKVSPLWSHRATVGPSSYAICSLIGILYYFLWLLYLENCGHVAVFAIRQLCCKHHVYGLTLPDNISEFTQSMQRLFFDLLTYSFGFIYWSP
jgi:hypothetical protein